MIKAIETRFDGQVFRSRLEARWAVFFKSLGVEYEYEKEGFDLDGKWYLPDFYLPHIDTWLEIKPHVGLGKAADAWPSHPMFDFLGKHDELGLVSICTPNEHINFILLVGTPKIDPPTMGWWGEDNFHYNSIVLGDCYYRWCECPHCGFIGIQFDGRSSRLECRSCRYCWECIDTNNLCPYHTDKFKIGCPPGKKDYNCFSQRLLDAYDKATNWRF